MKDFLYCPAGVRQPINHQPDAHLVVSSWEFLLAVDNKVHSQLLYPHQLNRGHRIEACECVGVQTDRNRVKNM